MDKNQIKWLTPRDWAMFALKEANEMIGTDEYINRMADYRRYSLMADYLDHVGQPPIGAAVVTVDGVQYKAFLIEMI